MKEETKQKIKDFIEEKSISLALKIAGALASIIIIVICSRGETKIYKQNQVVKYNGAKYEIVKVEKRQDDLYEDYYDFRVTVKITNNSKEEIEYSSSNYYIANKDGKTITKAGLAIDDGTFLQSGTLQPGESVEGVVSWNVIKDAKDIRVRYFKDIITATKGEFEFQWALDN